MVFRIRSCVVIATVVVLTAVADMPGYGQERLSLPSSLQPGRAVLVRGSIPVKGLPGFGLNALPGLSATYLYLPSGATAPYEINVWFSESLLPVPDGWTTIRCPGLPDSEQGPWTIAGSPPGPSSSTGSATRQESSDRSVPDPAAAGSRPTDITETLLILVNGKNYSILVEQPASLPNPCPFMVTLLDRFAFFYRYAASRYEVSFPSVLEAGR
mgnify:FL=1